MITKGSESLRACVIILLWAWGAASVSATPFRLVGSDLLGAGFVSALKDFAAENRIELEVDLSGSYRGRRDLEAGQAEIALLSASPGDEALPVEYSREPLAYYVTFLWVPRALSLPQLSYAQIAEIFSNKTAGSRSRWRDYGAQGEGNLRWAMPGRSEKPPGLALALLEHKLGRSITGEFDSIEPNAAPQDGAEGILIKALPPLPDDNWEAVAVALSQTGRAYLPTTDNVLRGDYPLNWPLRLVFRRTEVESLYPLLRFLLSDEIARELRKAGMMPLPETVRGERIFSLERL